MRFLEILFDLYKEEYELNLREGEIRTVEKERSKAILSRAFPDWEIEEYAPFDTDEERNDFSVLASGDLSKKNIDKFLVLLNNLGWFVSFLRVYGNDGERLYYSKYDRSALDKMLSKGNVSSVKFDCEAKFDLAVDKIPSVLYHVTPAKNWDKISKIGLSPRSRSKTSYHPERVYLSTTKEGIKKLTPAMYSVTGIKDWVVIEVDTSMIPGGYLKLYKDSNFRPSGMYTMNNIPPSALSKVATMEFKFKRKDETT